MIWVSFGNIMGRSAVKENISLAQSISCLNEIMSMRQHPLLREMLEPGARPDGKLISWPLKSLEASALHTCICS